MQCKDTFIHIDQSLRKSLRFLEDDYVVCFVDRHIVDSIYEIMLLVFLKSRLFSVFFWYIRVNEYYFSNNLYIFCLRSFPSTIQRQTLYKLLTLIPHIIPFFVRNTIMIDQESDSSVRRNYRLSDSNETLLHRDT